MGKSIKVNYFLNMSYQVLVLLVPIVTTPYIARTLGAEGIGIYSYTYSVVSCFVLAAVMGTTSYAQRTIAYYQNDVVERSRKFFDVFSFRLVTTLLWSAVYCVYLASGFCKYKVPALVQMLYLVAVAADVSWLFQGMEEFKKIVVRDTLTKLLNVFLLFLMVKSPDDVVVYTGILGGMTLLGNLSVWPYVPRLVCAIPMREWRPFKDVREIFLLFIPTIAIQLYSVLDKMMIGAFSPSAAENGYYEQTEKVVRVALMVVTSLGTVVAPRIAQLYHKQDEARIKSYLKKSFQFVWLLGVPIMCGLIGFAHLFVPVFYGPGYEKIEILMPIYSCVVVAVSISNVVGVQYLIPTKQQNVYTMAVVTSAVVNVAMNAVLIPRFLSVGAAAASVAAEAVGASMLLAFLSGKKLVNIGELLRLSVKNWIGGLLMLVAVYLFCRSADQTFLMLCVAIGGGASVYFGALLLMRDAFLMENIKMVYARLRNKRNRQAPDGKG